MAMTRACSLADLPQDRALRVVIDDTPIAIVRDAAGEVHAIGDTCSHGQISLADGFLENDTLECWAHGSAFSITTGKPLNLPAYEPVPIYEVTISGDDVLIDPTQTKEIG